MNYKQQAGVKRPGEQAARPGAGGHPDTWPVSRRTSRITGTEPELIGKDDVVHLEPPGYFPAVLLLDGKEFNTDYGRVKGNLIALAIPAGEESGDQKTEFVIRRAPKSRGRPMPPKTSQDKRNGEPPAQPKRLLVRVSKRCRRVRGIPDAPLVAQRVTRHGQITIPKICHDRLNISEGDAVEFVEVEGGLILRPKKVSRSRRTGLVPNPAWQESGRQAEAAKRAGRYRVAGPLAERGFHRPRAEIT